MFTKEALLEAVKGKLTANGKSLAISDRTLKKHVEDLYDIVGVNEESELDDIVGRILPLCETLDGNYRKDHADFIKDWETKNPKPQDKPKPNQEPNGDANKQLLDEIAKLRARLDAQDEEKSLREKKAQLFKALTEKGIDQSYLDTFEDVISVNKDTDINAETEKWVSKFNKMKEPSPYQPRRTRGGNKDIDDEFAAIKASREAQLKQEKEGL